MKRTLVLALTWLLSVVVVNFSQNVEVSKTPLPKGDPFKLERGTFFSASSEYSRKKESGVQGMVIYRDQVTADLGEALDIIRNNYVDGKRVNYSELTKSSIGSMLRTLDPHSNYYDSDEYQELLSDQHSEY